VYFDAGADSASPAAAAPDAHARTTQLELCKGCAAKIPADIKFCGRFLHDFVSIQGGEDPQDAFSCMSFFAKEPLIIGPGCGK